MNLAADVRSIPAVRDWLAAVVAYRESAAEALAGVDMEVRRGFDWIGEQQALWQRAARDAEDEVVRAKAELNTRKAPDWSGREPDTTVQEKALRRAQAKLEHCHEQIAKCRSWLMKLPKLIDESYNGAARRLGLFLEGDMVRGLAVLERRIESLERYAALKPDFAPAPSAGPPPAAGGAS